MLVYVPGKLLVTADTLSRAVESNKDKLVYEKTLENEVELYVNSIINTMPFSDDRLSEIKVQTSSDPTLTTLKRVILEGWPESKSQCSPDIIEYWNIRDELSVANDIIYKGSKIVIPKCMRKNILAKIHEGHMGIEKCRKRGREVLYWPQINADIEQMVKNCSACLKYSAKKPAEPLLPHEVPLRPFQRLSSDLFTCRNHDYLIVTDNFSFYPEVLMLPNTNAKAVIEGHKTVFARHGTPDVLVTDNGPQYSSAEFKKFSQDWEFKHVTSSPHFPSSNGLAEASVKVVKNMLLKCIESGDDFYKSLQAYRATPLDCGKSPAQLLMQRRIKTSLPVSHSLLKTENDSEIVDMKIKQKEKLKEQFDKHSQLVPSFKPGTLVSLLNSRTGRWDTTASVIKEISPRSYIVETSEGVRYRRNSRHLKPMSEPELYKIKEQLWKIYSNSDPDSRANSGNMSGINGHQPPELNDSNNINSTGSTQVAAQRRSGRMIKRPERLIEQC